MNKEKSCVSRFVYGFLLGGIFFSALIVFISVLQPAKKVPIDFVVLQDTLLQVDTVAVVICVDTSGFYETPAEADRYYRDDRYQTERSENWDTLYVTQAHHVTIAQTYGRADWYEPPTHQVLFNRIVEDNPGSILIDVANGKVYDLVSVPIKYPEYKVEARERKEAQ